MSKCPDCNGKMESRIVSMDPVAGLEERQVCVNSTCQSKEKPEPVIDPVGQGV
jgi:hypothetical protein